jgi:peptidyl-prolyl cis-trans isomerase C
MITVNDTTIPDSAVFAEMQYHPARNADMARRAAAEALVIRELLTQAAQEAGFASDEDGIAALLESRITVPEPDEETCRRYYEANRKRFRSPDVLEAQHILLAAAPDDDEARIKANERARTLLAMIERDPSCFAALAQEHSDCPSKSNGGHLGQITRGSTVPEFETYLFSLDAGELCPQPVPSRYGIHIVRLLQRENGRELPYEHVRAAVADYLQDSAWRNAVRQFMQILIGQARIEGIELQGAATPLVQ